MTLKLVGTSLAALLSITLFAPAALAGTQTVECYFAIDGRLQSSQGSRELAPTRSGEVRRIQFPGATVQITGRYGSLNMTLQTSLQSAVQTAIPADEWVMLSAPLTADHTAQVSCLSFEAP